MHLMNTGPQAENTICGKCGKQIPYGKSMYAVRSNILCIQCFDDFKEIIDKHVSQQINVYLKDSPYKNPSLVWENIKELEDEQ